jgi:hypothetical protein
MPHFETAAVEFFEEKKVYKYTKKYGNNLIVCLSIYIDTIISGTFQSMSKDIKREMGGSISIFLLLLAEEEEPFVVADELLLLLFLSLGASFSLAESISQFLYSFSILCLCWLDISSRLPSLPPYS